MTYVRLLLCPLCFLVSSLVRLYLIRDVTHSSPAHCETAVLQIVIACLPARSFSAMSEPAIQPSRQPGSRSDQESMVTTRRASLGFCAG